LRLFVVVGVGECADQRVSFAVTVRVGVGVSVAFIPMLIPVPHVIVVVISIHIILVNVVIFFDVFVHLAILFGASAFSRARHYCCDSRAVIWNPSAYERAIRITGKKISELEVCRELEAELPRWKDIGVLPPPSRNTLAMWGLVL
jgi:hypothetical protein